MGNISSEALTEEELDLLYKWGKCVCGHWRMFHDFHQSNVCRIGGCQCCLFRQDWGEQI